MNAITVTDDEIRVHADSWIAPIARTLRKCPDSLALHYGLQLVQFVSEIADLCEQWRRALMHIVFVSLAIVVDYYSIILQKPLPPTHVELGASMTGTLSSE